MNERGVGFNRLKRRVRPRSPAYEASRRGIRQAEKEPIDLGSWILDLGSWILKGISSTSSVRNPIISSHTLTLYQKDRMSSNNSVFSRCPASESKYTFNWRSRPSRSNLPRTCESEVLDSGTSYNTSSETNPRQSVVDQRTARNRGSFMRCSHELPIQRVSCLVLPVPLDLPVPAETLTSGQKDAHNNGTDYDDFTQLLHVSSSSGHSCYIRPFA